MIDDPSTPLLSVVTICYRNPDDLRRTLETLHGLPAGAEVVIVDGSPDDACARVAIAFPEARHTQQRDSGKYDAMNKGIAAARGAALLFLNSGDELDSVQALARLIEEYGDLLGSTIVYGDCRHRSADRDIMVPAPVPEGENLRLGRLPSHQSTVIPRAYHERHPYDASMHFAADTAFLKQAYCALPSRHFPEVIGIFAHGGASTSPGSIAMLWKQFFELSRTHELTRTERLSIAVLLVRRKLLHLIVGERRLQQLQAWRLSGRHGASR